ncbi:MAG: DMT family transporter [Caulobacterales bacterium]
MNTSSAVSLSILMFATGIGIPIMAALNANLGARLGSPYAAGFITFVVGAIVAGIALLLTGGAQRLSFNAPAYLYAGGCFVAFYVLSITYVAPRLGLGTAVFFVLLGQIAAAATIDHFGLFGAHPTPITLQRIAGIALMAAGLFLARRVV